MKPIDDWRQAWRLWSLRVCAAAIALYTFLLTFPEQALAIWLALPDEVQVMVPNRTAVATWLFVAVAVARVLRQPGTEPRS